MRFLLSTLLIILTSMALQGCETPREIEVDTPEPTSAFNDPDNELLKVAMHSFFESNGTPISSTYNFVRFDLDGDKRRDALVMIKTPYGYWCGQHGCVMLIMKAHNTGFSLVNSIQPVREPVYISRAKLNGWNNLVVRVSGRKSDKAKFVVLRSDGKRYPKDPGKLEAYPLSPANHPDFIRVLYQDGVRD